MTAEIKDVDVDILRDMGDRIKDKLTDAIVVFATVSEDKVIFLVMASNSAVEKGAHAGNIIKEVAKVAGGGGGGKPNMAQAGGKDASKVQEALSKAVSLVEAL